MSVAEVSHREDTKATTITTTVVVVADEDSTVSRIKISLAVEEEGAQGQVILLHRVKRAAVIRVVETMATR